MNEQNQVVTIPVTGQTLANILNYLASRPYADVATLIQELNKDLKAYADAQKAREVVSSENTQAVA